MKINSPGFNPLSILGAAFFAIAIEAIRAPKPNRPMSSTSTNTRLGN